MKGKGLIEEALTSFTKDIPSGPNHLPEKDKGLIGEALTSFTKDIPSESNHLPESPLCVVVVWFYFGFWCFETRSHCVVLVVLELTM